MAITGQDQGGQIRVASQYNVQLCDMAMLATHELSNWRRDSLSKEPLPVLTRVNE